MIPCCHKRLDNPIILLFMKESLYMYLWPPLVLGIQYFEHTCSCNEISTIPSAEDLKVIYILKEHVTIKRLKQT